jgi:alpha-N-arabinofuranosidase
MLKSGSDRPIYISFDEWSSAGDNLTGSLMVAQHLNSFIRHADIVKMANITMLSSLVGNSPDGDFKNSIFQSFYLYSNNCHGTSLDVYASCEKYSNDIFNDEVNGETTTSRNTRTEEAVSISTKDIKFRGNTISYSFPAHSFTQLQIPFK